MLETFSTRFTAVLFSGYFYWPVVLSFRSDFWVAAGPSSLERAQGGPKGLGMGGGAGKISLGGTRRSCRTDGGKTDPYLANLWLSEFITVVSVDCF